MGGSRTALMAWPAPRRRVADTRITGAVRSLVVELGVTPRLPVSADLVAVIVFEADLHPPPGPILIRIATLSVRARRAAIAVDGLIVAARSPILTNGSLILVHHAAAIALT